MKKYIFTERNGIYIIDLQKTVKKLDEAYNYVKEVAATSLVMRLRTSPTVRFSKYFMGIRLIFSLISRRIR